MFDASRFADPAGQTYGSFLILPVQRMASVVNATTQLNKYTEQGHIDKQEIEAAKTAFEEAAGMVDQAAVKYKELERLERGCAFTEDSIGGTWVVPSLSRKLITIYGRITLDSAPLGTWVVPSLSRKLLKRQPVLDGDVTRELVVMSDMIMLLAMEKSDDRRPKQAVEHSFHISHGSCKVDLTKLEFTLSGEGFSYTLRAPNAQEFGTLIAEAQAEAQASPRPNPLEPPGKG